MTCGRGRQKLPVAELCSLEQDEEPERVRGRDDDRRHPQPRERTTLVVFRIHKVHPAGLKMPVGDE